MLVYAIAVAVAFVIPAVTRGSYSRMFGVRWRFGSILFAGLAIQIVLEYVAIPRAHWHDVGFGLLVASYVFILAFAARNLVLRGMGIVFIGIACNALVVTANQGMPVKFPPEWQGKSWAQATVKHHPRQPDDKLRFLSDIIVLKAPFDSVISFGDLILMVGLCDVAYNASRKAKSRSRPPREPRRGRRARRARRAKDSRRTRRSRRIHTPRRTPLDLTADAPDSSPPARGSADDQELALTRSRSTRSRATTTRSS